MSEFYLKIKNNINIMFNNYKSDIKFSYKYAIFRVINYLSFKLHFTSIFDYTKKKMNEHIVNYLEKLLKPVVDKYKFCTYLGEKNDFSPIWVCWWSGMETAPTLVKKCVKSIQMHANGHEVHIITQDNYDQYLNIPTYILDKVESGEMCIANFSDYLRASLIRKYGGLWLDATIYCSKDIPQEYFDYPFFSCKRLGEQGKYISDYRWTSFFIGGWKNNTFYSFFQEAFELYWKNESQAIDYLLVDYIINLAYESVDIAKKLIDDVPLNNVDIEKLQEAMNRSLPASEFDKVVNDDTILYKLSWRERYSMHTVDNEESIYKYFLEL